MKTAWTEVEDEKIWQLQKQLGNKWSQIAAQMPGRTVSSITYYLTRWYFDWQSHCTLRVAYKVVLHMIVCVYVYVRIVAVKHMLGK
jgi:Myb-like DNA-binding domain